MIVRTIFHEPFDVPTKIAEKKCNGCMALPFLMPQKNSKARGAVVSFAAVIRVVTRYATVSGEERCVTSDDPNNGCEGD